MKIRESKDSDKQAIFSVHKNAFSASEGEDAAAIIAQLAVDLLEDETALPVLSVVAENASEIIGNVIFSNVITNDCAAGTIYILCPLAVARSQQNSGVGGALIKHGLDILERRGAEIVLVLGDPNYYCRSGFSPDHHIDPPYKLPYPETWLGQELVGGALKKISGVAQCADCLHVPELW